MVKSQSIIINPSAMQSQQWFWRRALCASVTILVVLACSVRPSNGSTRDKDALGKTAITAYAANISAFPYYKCRYRVTEGQAKSVEDAIQGKLINARFHDNRLIVNGEKDLHEGLAPPPDPKHAQEVPEKKGVFKVLSPGDSNRYLSDGKREMNYETFLRSINLFSAEKSSHGIAHTPLGMFLIGHRNKSGPDVLLAQKDRYDFSVVGPEEIDGRPVVTVRLDDKKIIKLPEGPATVALVFSFDASKGHLPVRITELRNGNPRWQVFVTHARECSNQRWFPERWVAVLMPEGSGVIPRVREIKLLELDADNRPGADEFSFVIPAGTSVLEIENTRKSFRLKQDEKISVEDLPTLFKMLERAQGEPLMDTALSAHRPTRWGWWAAGGSVLVLAVAALVTFRKLRTDRQAS